MNDAVIFLVLAGIALAFKWLTTRASNTEEEAPPPSPPNESSLPAERPDDTERIRRFLEALGAPPDAQPPSPVRPRPVAPRKVITPKARPGRARRWEQPLPPLTTAPPPLPREEEIPAASSVPVVVKLPPAPIVAAAPLPTGSRVVRPRFSLGEMLHDRGSLRRVVILREVLGPPLALQALDGLRRL